jgi:hypothetical protein
MTDSSLEYLSAAAQATNLSQTEILSQVVNAGLVAIAQNGNRMTLPLAFTIAEPEPAGRLAKARSDAGKGEDSLAARRRV